MSKTGLFLGFLTHPKSAYSSLEYEQFNDLMKNALTRYGFEVTGIVEGRNLAEYLNINVIDLINARIRWNYIAQANYKYLRGLPIEMRIRDWLIVFFRISQYCFKLRKRSFLLSEKLFAKRMANMVSGHLSLLDSFVKSGFEFGMIFEDDAEFTHSMSSINDLCDIILELYRNNLGPLYINLSKSFSLQELKAEGILGELYTSFLDVKGERQNIHQMKKLMLNTTCAVMYSRGFAERLLKLLIESVSKKSMLILPFDWIVTKELIHLQRVDGDNLRCFHNSPGIFIQLSLHPHP